MADYKPTRDAQGPGMMGKTAPAGGGKQMMPQGDGLKQAWRDQSSKPSMKSPMDAAKRRVK